MYMLKAQKRLAEIEKKEREERRLEEMGGLKIVRGAVATDFPDDGPEGAKKKVKYVGSFKVHPPSGMSGRGLQEAISSFVWDRVSTINPKRVSNQISGSVVVNRNGLRFYKDKSVFMAYPISKITYCTAAPKYATFTMVTKSIMSQPSDIMYAHVFALPSAEHASELSQLMSHAFKLALAHRTLRRDMKSDKDSSKKKSSGPWDALKRKKKSPTSTPTPDHRETSQSSHLPVPSGATAGTSPVQQHRRAGSVSSAGVTKDSLQTEIASLRHQISSIEHNLQSISPESNQALELTIQLSALEDQLQIKQEQLVTFELMPQIQVEPSAPLPTPANLPPPYSDAMVTGSRASNRLSGWGAEEELILQESEWYQAGLPRVVAMDMLEREGPGAFLVRDSSSNPGCHALSVKLPNGAINHYLIVKNEFGYYLDGSTRYHPSLLALVLHHASTPEFIPIALSLGSSNPLLRTPSPQPRRGKVQSWVYEEGDDIDDDEMLQHLGQLNFLS